MFPGLDSYHLLYSADKDKINAIQYPSKTTMNAMSSLQPTANSRQCICLHGVAVEGGIVAKIALSVLLLLSVILWLEVVLGSQAVAASVLALEVDLQEDGEDEGHADGGDKSDMTWLVAVKQVSM